MRVNSQKSTFLTRRNNNQSINGARANSKKYLASVLNGSVKQKKLAIYDLFDNKSTPGKLFTTEEDKYDMPNSEQLTNLADVIEVITIIGRDHIEAAKYETNRNDIPTMDGVTNYMKKIGVNHDMVPHIINICLHTGRSEKYSLFGGGNFHTDSANNLHNTIMSMLDKTQKKECISHLTIKEHLDGTKDHSEAGDLLKKIKNNENSSSLSEPSQMIKRSSVKQLGSDKFNRLIANAQTMDQENNYKICDLDGVDTLDVTGSDNTPKAVLVRPGEVFSNELLCMIFNKNENISKFLEGKNLHCNQNDFITTYNSIKFANSNTLNEQDKKDFFKLINETKIDQRVFTTTYAIANKVEEENSNKYDKYDSENFHSLVKDAGNSINTESVVSETLYYDKNPDEPNLASKSVFNQPTIIEIDVEKLSSASPAVCELISKYKGKNLNVGLNIPDSGKTEIPAPYLNKKEVFIFSNMGVNEVGGSYATSDSEIQRMKNAELVVMLHASNTEANTIIFQKVSEGKYDAIASKAGLLYGGGKKSLQNDIESYNGIDNDTIQNNILNSIMGGEGRYSPNFDPTIKAFTKGSIITPNLDKVLNVYHDGGCHNAALHVALASIDNFLLEKREGKENLLSNNKYLVDQGQEYSLEEFYIPERIATKLMNNLYYQGLYERIGMLDDDAADKIYDNAKMGDFFCDDDEDIIDYRSKKGKLQFLAERLYNQNCSNPKIFQRLCAQIEASLPDNSNSRLI